MKLIITLCTSLFMINCFGTPIFMSPDSANHITQINTTVGQELFDLQVALDSGAITQEEYDELKQKVIERLELPNDEGKKDGNK